MRKLYLSRENGKIFGVCAGIGESYDIDPTVVRLVTVSAARLSAIVPVGIIYLIAWAIIPEKK